METSIDELFNNHKLRYETIQVDKLKQMCNHSDDFYNFLIEMLRLYGVDKGVGTIAKFEAVYGKTTIKFSNLGEEDTIIIDDEDYKQVELRIGFIREFIKGFPFPKDSTTAQEIIEVITSYSETIDDIQHYRNY